MSNRELHESTLPDANKSASNESAGKTLPENEVVLVSACLLGVRCRYDGTSNPARELLTQPGVRLVPVCPEQLGGLPTPRPPAWLVGGTGRDVLAGRARVVNVHGEDVTQQFVKGAQETLRVARACGARRAILKEKSPSCGSCTVYVDGELTSGEGVTAALLRQHGFEIISLDPPKERVGTREEQDNGA